jgi:hypothetical protein
MSDNEMTSERLPRGPAPGKGLRFLPALGAFVIVGLSLYASQASLRPAKESNLPARGKLPEQEDAKLAQTTKAVAAAKAFLDSLDEKQRAKALLDFDSPKKAGWSNLPVTMVPRNGVRTGDMTKAQRDAAMSLLAAVLSKHGYQKVVDIMNADEALARGEGGGKKGKGGGKGGKGGKGGMPFGNDEFFLALFGKPSATQPWFVQFGGHHLGLNVTVIGKESVLTPTLTATQPDSFKRDGKTVRPLGPENDKAFALVNALDEKQQAQAILQAKPKDLQLGPGRDGKELKAEGIKGSAMTDRQQAMLLDLIGEWVKILEDHSAEARMAEIKSKVADTFFAWCGPTTNGSAAYFRVQAPTLVIEYAPQGSTSHIHTVIRDPSNDYGQKLIKR